MAFTTATVTSITQGISQFQGIFSEMWAVTLIVDPPSIAAGAEEFDNFTIPGLRVGDMVIGVGIGVNMTTDADVSIDINSSDTLTIRISNLHASTALSRASSTWKVLIGRPGW